MHVLDTIPPLLRIIDLALKEETPQGSVYERCYVIGANLNKWVELSTKFAEVFHARGLIPSPIPRSVKREEVDDGGEIAMLMARDQLFLSERAEKTLGYKPRQKPLVEDLQTAMAEFEL
jgi:hypothetical protein